LGEEGSEDEATTSSRKAMTTEELAGQLYEHYCTMVGGKNFQGDSLPSWEEFRSDESKLTQSSAWVMVAHKASKLLDRPLAE
jgi:hypothetical protein